MEESVRLGGGGRGGGGFTTPMISILRDEWPWQRHSDNSFVESPQNSTDNADLPASQSVPTAPSPKQYEIWVELHPCLGEYPEDGGSFTDDIAKIEKLMDEIEARLLNGEDFGEVLGESGIV